MSATLCVFNPEHDLCLANGDKNYVPPASALRFAHDGASLMSHIYPDAVASVAVDDVAGVVALWNEDTVSHLVPWGWDASLKHRLLKAGVPCRLLPTDACVAMVRTLQHRTTVLPLQDGVAAAVTLAEVERMVAACRRVVLKAPWSGAGRGLRWVSDTLSSHDAVWVEKVIGEQRCVMVEPRHEVVADFALEFFVASSSSMLPVPASPVSEAFGAAGVRFLGYSLFQNQSGVYRRNILWTNARIEAYLLPLLDAKSWQAMKKRVAQWFAAAVVGRYEGPVGIDFVVDDRGVPFVSEANFRHTMGMASFV